VTFIHHPEKFTSIEAWLQHVAKEIMRDDADLDGLATLIMTSFATVIGLFLGLLISVIRVAHRGGADDEGLVDADAVHLAGEVEDQLVRPVRIDLRAFSPGQIAHVKPPYCSGAV